MTYRLAPAQLLGQSALAVLAFATVIAVGRAQEAPAPASAGWETLRRGGFALSAPDDWDVDTSGAMGTALILMSPLGPDGDDFRENVNVMVQDVGAYGLDLDGFVALSEEQVTTFVTDAEFVSSERDTTGIHPSHRLVYTGRQGKYALRFEQRYWVVDGRAYILTFTAEEDAYEGFAEVGTRVLESFALE